MRFKLIEFARSRNEILRDLSNNSDSFIQHMILIFLTRESNTFNHWLHEIHNFYAKLPKMKSGKSFLNEKDIYNKIFGEVEDIWDNIWITSVEYLDYKEADYHIKDMIDNGSKDMSERCHTFIKNYTRWLAHELSTKGYVLYKEAEDKIKFELGIS